MPNPQTDGSLVVPPQAVVSNLPDNAINTVYQDPLGQQNVALIDARRSQLFPKDLRYDMIKQKSLGD